MMRSTIVAAVLMMVAVPSSARAQATRAFGELGITQTGLYYGATFGVPIGPVGLFDLSVGSSGAESQALAGVRLRLDLDNLMASIGIRTGVVNSSGSNFAVGGVFSVGLRFGFLAFGIQVQFSAGLWPNHASYPVATGYAGVTF